jgi:hypothetical protein
MLMTGQLRRPGRWSVSIPLVCVEFLTLLAISLSRDKGKGGGAEAVNGCVSFMADMSLGPSVWSSCNVGNGEGSNGAGAAAIEGAGLGIRRLRRDKDDLFAKLRRSFVSQDTRIEFPMAIGELSISVVMVLDCLFEVLRTDESAIPSKCGMVSVPLFCDSLWFASRCLAQWEA